MTSIRYRILIALLIAGFIPVILILTVSQTLTRQALRESQFNQTAELAGEVAKKIANFVAASNADLENLATNPIVYEDVDVLPPSSRAAELVKKEAWFTRTVLNYQHFNDIILYTLDGFYVTSKVKENRGYRDGTDWLRKAADGDSIVSAPIVREETAHLQEAELEMLYYKPVVGDQDGEPTYVIKASLNFSHIWKALDEAQVGATRFILTDERENILFCEDNSKVLTQRSPVWFV